MALLMAGAAQAGSPAFIGSFSKAYVVPDMPVNATTRVTYRIENTSGFALQNVAFGDAFASGLGVAVIPSPSTSCGGAFVTPAGGAFGFSGGSVADAATCTVTVDVTGTTPGVKDNPTTVLSSSSHRLMPAGARASITILAAAVTSAASIPTLSEWGLILLVLAMAASAFNAFRRKR